MLLLILYESDFREEPIKFLHIRFEYFKSTLHYFVLLYTCKSTSVWISVINFGEDATSSLTDGMLDLCTSSWCSWALEVWLLAFVILQQSRTKKTILFFAVVCFLLHSFRIICIFETKGDVAFYEKHSDVKFILIYVSYSVCIEYTWLR